MRRTLIPLLFVLVSWAPLSVHAEPEAPETESADSAAAVDSEAKQAPVTLAKPPVLLEEVPAELPGDTVFPGPEVAVELDLVVARDGSIREAAIAQGAGEPFDSAALAAAKRFKFEPAMLSNGEPTPVRVRFRMLIKEPPPPPTPPVKLTGTLLERGTRKPLVGVAVAIRVEGEVIVETVTDERGVFEIESPSATFDVIAVPSNHEKLSLTIEAEPGEERAETYFLLEAGGRFQTVVRGRKLKREVTKRVISREQVLLVAGTQGDAIKVVENLPGANRAASAGPGAGDIVLRGSNPGDSLIFLEGHEIPLIYHFGALRSTFNSAFLESVDFVPGNFSGEFGRASGGVVQVRVRDLDEEMFRGHVDLNLYDAGVVLEGPLGDGWTGGFAFHRSYADAVLGVVLPDNESFSFQTLPRYFDYQLILSKKTSERGRFRFMAYGSDDRLELLFEDTGNDP
ncbi:MAG: TonB family protein, partial [Myxococcota bacterium]|nr:TonB family protein [Myxococcota bacterium]